MKCQLRGVFILFTLIYRNILIAPTKQFPVDNVAAKSYSQSCALGMAIACSGLFPWYCSEMKTITQNSESVLYVSWGRTKSSI